MLWKGVMSTPRFIMYRCSSASSSPSRVRRTSLALRGASAQKSVSTRAPTCVACHGNPAAVMLALTPSARRCASTSMRSKASGVSTCESTARITATVSALPASVPPKPACADWRFVGCSLGSTCQTRSAVSTLRPKAAAGMPPAMALPITNMSGSSPCWRV
ncbi:hypothetical protein D9M68_480430 [compost metagenome]